jgi:hypothetical protein
LRSSTAASASKVMHQVNRGLLKNTLAQAQLVFLIGLRRLDPRALLLELPLSRQAGQGQQAEQSFVVARSKREFPLASRPALLAVMQLGTRKPPSETLAGAAQLTSGTSITAEVYSRHHNRNVCFL